jgi:hypothetical protein
MRHSHSVDVRAGVRFPDDANALVTFERKSLPRGMECNRERLAGALVKPLGACRPARR